MIPHGAGDQWVVPLQPSRSDDITPLAESRRMTERRSVISLTLILAVAAVLRALNLNAELWFDEIVSVLNFVEPRLSTVLTSYGLANNHVLNSALMNVAGSLLGTEPWMLRLPAALFGVAGVWAFHFTATAIWPRTPAMVGTLLFATSYHHVYYSQNARGYSALMFFTLLSTGALLRLLQPNAPPRRKYELAYCLALALGLYSMLLMVFVVVGHAAVMIALRRWRPLAWLAAGAAVAAVLYLPMADGLIAYYRTHPGETGYPVFSRRFLQALAPVAPALLVAAALMLPIARRFLRERPVAAAVLLAPAVLNVLLPLVRGQGVYPRSFMYGLVLGYLLLVEMLDQMRGRAPRLTAAAVAVTAAMSITALVPYYRLPKQGFRQALSFVEAHAADGERRVGLTVAGKAARYYDPRVLLVEDAESLREPHFRSGPPAWVFSTFPADLRVNRPALYQWLQEETELRASFPGVIGDGTVYVSYWPRRPSPPPPHHSGQ